MKCPHERIQYCPLYVESHNCREMGCVDDVGKSCEVERGKMDYANAKAALERVDFKLISDCGIAERQFERTEQRKRNMQHLRLR